MSTPSGSRSVTIARSASESMRKLVSTSLPFTFAASAARARPAPMDCATSAAVTGFGNDFDEPSGRRMLGITAGALRARTYTITMNIQLSLAIGGYDHVRDLLDGKVRASGISLIPFELPIEEVTFRFTRFAEWDVSELSFGKTVSLLSQDNPQIVPIPVFPSRVFRHSAIYVGEGKKIRTPKDLEGKRVGIPEWAQTAGIYVRGMLQHEYGVDLSAIDWYQAGVNQPGRTEKVALKLPKGLRLTPAPDKSLSGM